MLKTNPRFIFQMAEMYGRTYSANWSFNPWHSEGFNLTKQAELLKSDPTKAAQLKAAAGVKQGHQFRFERVLVLSLPWGS